MGSLCFFFGHKKLLTRKCSASGLEREVLFEPVFCLVWKVYARQCDICQCYDVITRVAGQCEAEAIIFLAFVFSPSIPHFDFCIEPVGPRNTNEGIHSEWFYAARYLPTRRHSFVWQFWFWPHGSFVGQVQNLGPNSDRKQFVFKLREDCFLQQFGLKIYFLLNLVFF